ncbi:MAG TPA: glycosyltransferase family 4 protein [Hyphomicrobiaceae bacterium]|jgi:glycosyltransferase involved in cell wall biosynthesis|nr:glycosyltransferase family 4 protein [Hyphomicrobiaceae bacterium]
MVRRLLLLTRPRHPGEDFAFAETLSLSELKALVRSGQVANRILRYNEVVLRTEHLHAFPRPFLLACLLRTLSRGACIVEDHSGCQARIGWPQICRQGMAYLRDWWAAPRARAAVERQLGELEARNRPAARPIPGRGRALYLRSDLWLGTNVGGALAHTAGIANALADAGMAPVLLAYTPLPTLRAAVEQRQLPIPPRYWNLPELPAIAANLQLAPLLAAAIAELQPAFLYHRYAQMSYAGALAARRLGIPLILEYNGSEVWIANTWGAGLRYEGLARRIEDAVLRAADRIVTVSEPLSAELRARGLPAERIVTQPNGVDTRRFRPDLDGAPLRRRLGIAGHEIVIGFIGSFAVWHGISVLVAAYARLIGAHSQLRQTTRLLLIGDGALRGAIEAEIEALGLVDRTILAGAIPQGEAPHYLAATDILAAPHVPNPDGSEFFGSPTKLFEYMAMGRCIVASAIGQIGDILSHERTALLVRPGESAPLAAALLRAVSNPALRQALGAAARRQAVERHDWRQALANILAPPASSLGKARQ